MVTCLCACGLRLISVLLCCKIESMVKKDKLYHEIKLSFAVISLVVVFFLCVYDKFLGHSPNTELYELEIESNFCVTLSSQNEDF